MRQLKFRAWDTKDKIMWLPLDFNDLLRGRWELGTADQEWSLPKKDYLDFAHSDTIWMQFTGLQDRHGADIYEGDIISDGEGIGVVRWKAPGFIVCDAAGDEFWLGAGKCYPEGQNQLKNTEVVGNVHEHPHLLTEHSPTSSTPKTPKA